jgi:hypothetical protein
MPFGISYRHIKMSDEELELRPVEVNGEIVYVTRCGDLWRWKRDNQHSTPTFRKIVNKPTSLGYIHPKIGGNCVKQHRIIASAFLGLEMFETKIQVDHINGMKHDNRLVNLRLVTHQQNQHNRTKALGYSWHKQNNKWKAKIKLDGRTINLGYFINESDARQAYLDAKLKYHII